MSSHMSSLTLVTGATGNVGSEVVRALREAGAPTRALVRSADAGRAALPAGVETAVGDLDDPGSLAAALEGVRNVFLLPGYRDMPGVVAAARAAGVQRVVQLSGGSAGSGDRTNAVTAYMMRSEEAVRESGLEHTILRPAAFMSNAFRWLPQLSSGDVVRVQFPHVRTAVLDPADLGAVAARSLVTDDWLGQILVPTGPESLRPAEQVATLASVLDRDLSVVELDDDETRAQMEADHTPLEYINAFFDFYANGSLDESVVRPTVFEVTGRLPRTFAKWAEAHADAFAHRHPS
jgi:uncharacterized protein YbjT (DUF2867 family)